MKKIKNDPVKQVVFKDVKNGKIKVAVTAEYELHINNLLNEKGHLHFEDESVQTLEKRVFSEICAALFSDAFGRVAAKRASVKSFETSEELAIAFKEYAVEYAKKLKERDDSAKAAKIALLESELAAAKASA
jgi:hypothetical protein